LLYILSFKYSFDNPILLNTLGFMVFDKPCWQFPTIFMDPKPVTSINRDEPICISLTRYKTMDKAKNPKLSENLC